MDRIDSGFEESSRLRTTEEEPLSGHKNIPPTVHRRKPKRIGSNANPTVLAVAMENPLEKCPTGRTSADTRRQSVSSTSDHSTNKSRNRGRGSKPSSRRTSCTLVDPTRPARHYRVKSSQTIPTVNRDIDDVLAFHFRSCTLFENPSYHSGHHVNTISGHGHGTVDTDASCELANSVSAPSPLRHDRIETIPSPKQSEETVSIVEVENTIMHWTSPSTRRIEYEKIDRANSGLRGFARKIIPRCVSGPPPPRFYENDKSDAGSVRRYRMDLSDDDVEEAEVLGDEKSTSSLRHQHRRLEKSTKTPITRKKRWGCF